MRETREDGVPFFFAMRRPPSAIAIDEDIYLTVTTADPCFPEKLATVDIILSIDYARQAIAQLSGALIAATKNESGASSTWPFRRRRLRP
jgi:hypothetical protein